MLPAVFNICNNVLCHLRFTRPLLLEIRHLESLQLTMGIYKNNRKAYWLLNGHLCLSLPTENISMSTSNRNIYCYDFYSDFILTDANFMLWHRAKIKSLLHVGEVYQTIIHPNMKSSGIPMSEF